MSALTITSAADEMPDAPADNACARACLSALVGAWETAGGSQAAFARDVLARDADNLRDWLGGRAMPRQLADWVQRVNSVARDRKGHVVITVAPRAMQPPGRRGAR